MNAYKRIINCSLILVLLSFPTSFAYSKTAPSSFADLAEKLMPSVVNISTTQTINYWFGACVAVPGTGIILNNEMDDFSIHPDTPNKWGLVGGDANAIEAKKRPLSSMSPTLVLRDNEPVLVLGSPGGPKIITSVLQAIVNVIEYNISLDIAVAGGRIHHQWLPDRVFIERGLYPGDTIEGLRAIGHDVEETDKSFGEIQAIQRLSDGGLLGISDPRRSGGVVGF